MTTQDGFLARWVPSLLDCFPMAAIIVDAAGVVLAANARAQLTLENQDGIVATSASRQKCGSSPTSLSELLSRCDANRDDPFTTIVPRSGNDSSWLVRVKSLEGACSNPTHLLTWVDPRSAPATDWGFVASIYGLSQAEKKVAALLANGDDLATAAKKLGIKHDTARSHLKSIFRKMHLHRQQELIRITAMMSFVC